ncbi:MAG: hypothetical protein COC17_03955 [Hyphomicrobiales bacterium]|nr:hypothetical protein [Hyphomicrobiales bacterium]PCH50737.1 MAG: hypothetical protein COC17_03955 [Hyphomicrobiales bacterium]
MLNFLKNKSGSFVPIFALIAAVALPIAGGVYDYNLLKQKEAELQFVTHSAANEAMIAASDNSEFEHIAKTYLFSNISDYSLSAKRKMINGRITLQSTQQIELPFSSMIGLGNVKIFASSCLPQEFIGINKVENTRTYSEADILELERQFRRLINSAPREKRAAYRKKYTKHLQKIKSLNAPKRKVHAYKAADISVDTTRLEH